MQAALVGVVIGEVVAVVYNWRELQGESRGCELAPVH